MKTTIGRGRGIGAPAVLIVVSFLGAACGTPSTSKSSSSTATTSKTWSIVALGDSVPRGTNCDCRPYPLLSADGLTASTGQTVTATNDSVAGYTTSGVLRQLESDSTVIDHVRKARAVEIEVGANDVAYSKRCGTAVDCYAPDVPMVEKNLAEIVRRVREQSSGHKALVVLLDYWSIWLGGKYAAEKGDAYVNAAREMTDQVNAAIKSTAAQSGSAYVDLRSAFKGPSFGYLETHYLSSDGDHPNAAGHEAIARATEAVIEKALDL
jgi:lysophospholipase L1-like esterase